jgi:hypothetical protein
MKKPAAPTVQTRLADAIEERSRLLADATARKLDVSAFDLPEADGPQTVVDRFLAVTKVNDQLRARLAVAPAPAPRTTTTTTTTTARATTTTTAPRPTAKATGTAPLRPGEKRRIAGTRTFESIDPDTGRVIRETDFTLPRFGGIGEG